MFLSFFFLSHHLSVKYITLFSSIPMDESVGGHKSFLLTNIVYCLCLFTGLTLSLSHTHILSVCLCLFVYLSSVFLFLSDLFV